MGGGGGPPPGPGGPPPGISDLKINPLPPHKKKKKQAPGPPHRGGGKKTRGMIQKYGWTSISGASASNYFQNNRPPGRNCREGTASQQRSSCHLSNSTSKGALGCGSVEAGENPSLTLSSSLVGIQFLFCLDFLTAARCHRTSEELLIRLFILF